MKTCATRALKDHFKHPSIMSPPTRALSTQKHLLGCGGFRKEMQFRPTLSSFTVVMLLCEILLSSLICLYFDGVQGRPHCHVDYFELKLLMKQLVREGHTESSLTLKVEKTTLQVIGLPIAGGRDMLTTRDGDVGPEGYRNSPCYCFANLLLEPALPCLVSSSQMYRSYVWKDIKAAFLDHCFESLISMDALYI